MQRRGEKNLEKPQKLKKIRLKLLKCEKAENKFKILAKSQKVTHPSRISHYIMVAEVKKPKKATWLKKVKAEKLNVLSSRNSITWPRRCAGGKNDYLKVISIVEYIKRRHPIVVGMESTSTSKLANEGFRNLRSSWLAFILKFRLGSCYFNTLKMMLFFVRKCYTERIALSIERKNAAAKVRKRKKGAYQWWERLLYIKLHVL